MSTTKVYKDIVPQMRGGVKGKSEKMKTVNVIFALEQLRYELLRPPDAKPDFTEDQRQELTKMYLDGLTAAIDFIREKDQEAAQEHDRRRENAPTICLACLECSSRKSCKKRCDDEAASRCKRLAYISARLLG